MRWLICLFAAQAAFAQLVVKVVEQGPESPVEDVRVELRLAGGLGPASRLTRRYPECQTSPSGECTFDDLVPGHYAIRLSRAGFVDAEDLQSRVIGISILLQTPKPIVIEARVVRTGMLHGTVYTEDGKPIVLTPLKLLLMDPVEPRRRPPAIFLRTDDKGVFLAEDVPPGKYGLWIATPAGMRASARVTDAEAGEAIGYPVMVYHTGVEEEHWVEPVEVWPGAQLRNRVVVIRRMRVYRLRGQLIDSLTEKPMTNGLVALRTGDGVHEEVYSQRMVHPQTGVFSFSLLAPGDYELLVYRPSPDPSPPWVIPVTLERGRGVRDLSLTVPPWVDVTGAIRNLPGRFIQFETRVTLQPESSPYEPVPAIHEKGRFAFRPLPPGRYSLNVQTPDGCYASDAAIGRQGALEQSFAVTMAGISELVVSVGCDSGSVRGDVVDSRDQPVTRAYVLLAREFQLPAPRLGRVQLHRTGPEGEFYFGSLAPGEYWVVAVKDKPKADLDAQAFWRDYVKSRVKVKVEAKVSRPVVLLVREKGAN